MDQNNVQYIHSTENIPAALRFSRRAFLSSSVSFPAAGEGLGLGGAFVGAAFGGDGGASGAGAVAFFFLSRFPMISNVLVVLQCWCRKQQQQEQQQHNQCLLDLNQVSQCSLNVRTFRVTHGRTN